MRDGLPLREYLREVSGAEDVPESGGRQESRRVAVVLDVRDRDGRVADAVVDHGVHGHSHGVLRQDLGKKRRRQW